MKLSQHHLKQEAAGAEISYSSSPVLAYTAAGRSCLPWQAEQPKELGQGQKQGPGAVNTVLLSWSLDVILIPSKERNFCSSGRSASSTSQAGDRICATAVGELLNLHEAARVCRF